MEFVCRKDILTKALGMANKIVPSRTPLACLSSILATATADGISLGATNLELTVVAHLAEEPKEEGQALLPAKLFSEMVSTLPNDHLTISADDATVQVRCNRFRGKLKTTSPKGYPALTIEQGGLRITLDPKTLHTALSRVLAAAATDTTRPILQGINIQGQDNQIVLVGGDGFRMHTQEIQLGEPLATPFDVVVPATNLQELVRLLASAEIPVEMTILPTGNKVQFHLPNVDVVSQTISGEFPALRRFIPREWATRAVVDSAALGRIVKAANVFGREVYGHITVDINELGVVTVSARSESGDNEAEIDALSVEGSEQTFKVTDRYLMDLLGSVGSTHLVITTQGKNLPIVFRLEDDDGFVGLLMPVMTQ